MFRGRPKGSANGKDKGRKKGAFNLDRAIFRAALDDLNFEPVKELVEILKMDIMESGLSYMDKAEILRDLLPYLYPKLAAAELTIDNPNASSENDKVSRLYEELRTVLADPKPKDTPWTGSPPSLPLQHPSSSQPSDTE